ncbi:MAG: ABC transporter ATP-binding protein [Sneathiella sp.]|jgi:ABC-type Fe3+/spermidine/putrescine transport system ATPase subunit|uniref:ABC transporter ATP-binding protein n=1 Tax=Sneathiella sp. TaxID=1964365 RepID=UPI000C5620EE|nr:ABC transporter ATP-binding protein [Sneathiella sp.]MAL78914.1 ABC transporter ATP-binding protein [Sneathiella sp.]
MTEVALRNLCKTYPGADKAVVDDISLHIKSGSLTALLGPSGSGKSTILKMIAGLLFPTSGDILVGGHSVLSLPPEKRDIVLIFQDNLLFPYLSVAENIGFGLRMRRRPKAEIADAVHAIMNLMQIRGLEKRKPFELSGGQQQRVALARALVLRPRLLLLDEPFSNLDASLRLEMQSLLKELHRETGTTMLFVTHDQSEAVRLADRIALIFHGQLRQYDAPDAFYNRPHDRSVAEFFGGRNFIDGTLKEDHFECALGHLKMPADTPSHGSILTFRPENIIIGETSSATNRITAILEGRQFLGERTILHLRCGPAMFEAYSSPLAAASYVIGQPLSVCLPPDSLWLLP